MYKVGTKFRDKHGDWVVTNYEGTGGTMYGLRGDRGSIAIDEYSLNKFYKKVTKLKRVGEM